MLIRKLTITLKLDFGSCFRLSWYLGYSSFKRKCRPKQPSANPSGFISSRRNMNSRTVGLTVVELLYEFYRQKINTVQ